MIRLRSIGIAIAMICSLLLTPTVFAQLAEDNHAPDNIDASVSVSIDSLDYDSSGPGVVYLSGSFFVYNYDENRSCSYSGELRLEIFDSDGNTLFPDSKENVYGNLKKNDEDSYIGDVYDSFSESISSYMDCLDPKPEADKDYTAKAAITLRVTIGHRTETWEVNNPPHTMDFTHQPETEAEEISGLGPTTDGETFSDDCTCNLNSERDWQSLVITDTPYSSVYWYVKAPGDTSSLGTHVGTDWGDGVEKRATMTYSFPDDVPGTGAYYEITAYVYRWDNTVYWNSYLVWVNDK